MSHNGPFESFLITVIISLKSYGHVVSLEDLGSGLSAGSITTQINLFLNNLKEKSHQKIKEKLLIRQNSFFTSHHIEFKRDVKQEHYRINKFNFLLFKIISHNHYLSFRHSSL